MTFCVVVASYTLSYDTSGSKLLPGALVIVAVGAATGVFNAVLVCVLKLPSIIATLGTFSILEGAALLLRDHPEGPINADVVDGLTRSVSFIPVAFIVVVVLAVLGDAWLYRTRSGLALRAVGLDETSSRRLGMATGRRLAFVVCSVMAPLAASTSPLRFKSAHHHRQLRPREHRLRCRRSEPAGGRDRSSGTAGGALPSPIDNVLPPSTSRRSTPR
jgi:ribose/xylose/arabinose/galactoside ABC-type transport system permease subunit